MLALLWRQVTPKILELKEIRENSILYIFSVCFLGAFDNNFQPVPFLGTFIKGLIKAGQGMVFSSLEYFQEC